MFAQLAPLLRKGDTLIITAARENDTQLRVTVTPKLFTLDGESGEDRKALNQPVVVTGTIEELDSPAFIETLNRFTTSTNGLRQSIDEVEASHKTESESRKAKNKPSDKSSKSDKPDKEKPEPKEEKKPAADHRPKPEETTGSLI